MDSRTDGPPATLHATPSWDRARFLQTLRCITLGFGQVATRYPHERSVLSEMLAQTDFGPRLDWPATLRTHTRPHFGTLVGFTTRLATWVPDVPIEGLDVGALARLELRPPEDNIVVEVNVALLRAWAPLVFTYVAAPIMLRLGTARHARSDPSAKTRVEP